MSSYLYLNLLRAGILLEGKNKYDVMWANKRWETKNKSKKLTKNGSFTSFSIVFQYHINDTVKLCEMEPDYGWQGFRLQR